MNHRRRYKPEKQHNLIQTIASGYNPVQEVDRRFDQWFVYKRWWRCWSLFGLRRFSTGGSV